MYIQQTAIETLQENTTYLLEKSLWKVDKQLQNDKNGYLLYEIGYRYRILAICKLLLNADQDQFSLNLYKSACVRYYSIEYYSKRALDDLSFQCVSRNAGFIDALVSGYYDIATKIADITNYKFYPEYEYEDDYLLISFLQKYLIFVQFNDGADELKEILKRWEVVCEGATDDYLEVCEALLKKDRVEFEDKLSIIVQNRNVKFSEMLSNDEGKLEKYLADAYIFMNGLALLRLAKSCGVDISKQYASMPEISILPSKKNAVSINVWRDL